MLLLFDIISVCACRNLLTKKVLNSVTNMRVHKHVTVGAPVYYFEILTSRIKKKQIFILNKNFCTLDYLKYIILKISLLLGQCYCKLLLSLQD